MDWKLIGCLPTKTKFSSTSAQPLSLGSLLLQNLERLLRLSGRALLLRDAVLAPSLFELCPVVRLDLVPVLGRVRRAVLNDDVDDVEEVALVVQQLDGVGVGAFQLRVPRVLADDVGDGDVIACFEEVSARAVGVRLTISVTLSRVSSYFFVSCKCPLSSAFHIPQ